MVAQVGHYAAHFWKVHFEVVHSWVIHFEVPHYAQVVHYAEVARSVEAELRCAGVVLRCVVEFQRVLVVRYAGVSQSLVMAPHFDARVVPVQLVRDLAWAFHQSLNCRVTLRVRVASCRHQYYSMVLLPACAQDDH
jgi:hypothetical protein